MTANRASGTEIDRQLPVGRRNLSRSRRPFRPRSGRRRAGRWPARASRRRRCRCRSIPTAPRPAPATSPRCSAAAISRCCSRPPTRRSAANSMLSLAGHAGVHLAAFSIADAEGQHRRLTGAGFAMRPLVQFQRPVDTETGPGVAAFTVVRLERGAMAEGRIQMLAHRTEDTVWQPRWLTHRNGALGLVDLVVVCADVRGGRRALCALHRPRSRCRRSSARPSRSIAARCRSVFRRRIRGDVSGDCDSASAVHGRLCRAGAIARCGRGAA